MVLRAACGKQDIEIAEELGISNQKAARWRKRFLAARIEGLERDAPRSGRTHAGEGTGSRPQDHPGEARRQT